MGAGRSPTTLVLPHVLIQKGQPSVAQKTSSSYLWSSLESIFLSNCCWLTESIKERNKTEKNAFRDVVQRRKIKRGFYS
jgi:hypothetical protein